MYLNIFIRAFCTTKGDIATNARIDGQLKKTHWCIRGFVVFINQSDCGAMEFVELLYGIAFTGTFSQFLSFYIINAARNISLQRTKKQLITQHH